MLFMVVVLFTSICTTQFTWISFHVLLREEFTQRIHNADVNTSKYLKKNRDDVLEIKKMGLGDLSFSRDSKKGSAHRLSYRLTILLKDSER